MSTETRPTLTTIIDLDIACANGAAGMDDPDFVALCERFEAILEAECERMGWDCEVKTDKRASGARSNTTISDDEQGRLDDLLMSACDLVNACWDRALAG